MFFNFWCFVCFFVALLLILLILTAISGILTMCWAMLTVARQDRARRFEEKQEKARQRQEFLDRKAREQSDKEAKRQSEERVLRAFFSKQPGASKPVQPTGARCTLSADVLTISFIDAPPKIRRPRSRSTR